MELALMTNSPNGIVIQQPEIVNIIAFPVKIVAVKIAVRMNVTAVKFNALIATIFKLAEIMILILV
jgi:hypothetical protein